MHENTTVAIGIDVSDASAEVCVLDRTGVRDQFSVALSRDALLARIELPPAPQGVVVFETGTHAAWLKRLFVSRGAKVVVADSRKLGFITNSMTKTDRNDARRLAQLGLADALMAGVPGHQRILTDTFVRSEAHQDTYTLAIVRDQLVRRRGDFERLAKSTLKGIGLPSNRAAIRGMVEDRGRCPGPLRAALSPMLDVVLQMTTSIAELDKTLGHRAKTSPVGKLLSAVPGVGPVTAAVFEAVIGEPKRFVHARDVGAYLGLVPRRDQSGQVDRSLGITKAGNGFLRRLLVQCATHILGPHGKDSALRQWGLAKAGTGEKRNLKRARVAVARKLAVVLLKLWKDEVAWRAFPDLAVREDVKPSAPFGRDDCEGPLDRVATTQDDTCEIAASPTDPIQPCARPPRARTDESADRRGAARNPKEASEPKPSSSRGKTLSTARLPAAASPAPAPPAAGGEHELGDGARTERVDDRQRRARDARPARAAAVRPKESSRGRPQLDGEAAS